MELKDKLLLARADDVVERCLNRYCFCTLGFLSPAERTVIERNLPKTRDCSYSFWGGYDEAERVMFVCFPDYMEFDEREVSISVLEIRGREMERLNHRDFLGSVLALGIKREKVGDILPSDDKCLMFTSSDISEYICENLTKIGNAGVSAAIVDSGVVKTPPRAVLEITGTVANIRLDAVLSIALKVSRAVAAEYILSDNVQVNWIAVTQVSHRLSENDIFSVKGFGRFRLSKIGNLSKKGRQHITIEKFL